VLNTSHSEGRDVERYSNLETNFLTLRLLALSISLLNSLYTLVHASIDLCLIATYTRVILLYIEIDSCSLAINFINFALFTIIL